MFNYINLFIHNTDNFKQKVTYYFKMYSTVIYNALIICLKVQLISFFY